MKGNSTGSKNLTEQTFAGFSWMLLGSGFQVILKIIVLAVLARLVTPVEFGVMGVAMVIVELSKLFTHMGVGPALIQRKHIEKRHLTTGFTLSILMGLFFAGLLVLLAPAMAVFFKMPDLVQVLQVVSIVFLIDSLTLIAQALMMRNMKFKLLTSLEVSSYALGYGVTGIVLAYMGWGVWALVGATIAQAFLLAIFLVIVQPFPKRPSFEEKAFKELMFFGGGMTLAKIGNYLATHGDNLVVGRTLGAAALGVYGRAYQFMTMPAGLFGTALDKALFPAMSRVQGEKVRLAKAYLTGISLIALFAIPVSILFILLAREIVFVLLGPAWKDVVAPLQILAGGLLFRMSYKMSDSLARASAAVYRRAWRQVLYAILVIGGSLIGQFWGLKGVAYGVAVALIGNFLLMAHLSIQLTEIKWTDVFKSQRHGVIFGLITVLVAFPVVTFCRNQLLPDLITLIITGLGTLLVLALSVFIFPKLTVSDDQFRLFDMLVIKRFKTLYAKNA